MTFLSVKKRKQKVCPQQEKRVGFEQDRKGKVISPLPMTSVITLSHITRLSTWKLQNQK